MKLFSLLTVLIPVALSGCVHYRYDIPTAMLQAPDVEVWAVNVQKSDSGYRTHSITRLNGSHSVSSEPDSVIASGSTEEWQWEVRAVSSLLPSWRAWQNDKKVQQRSTSDDWGHPAATWEQAFARASKISRYLLGRRPLPAKLTLLLVPEGSAYKKDFAQTGTDFVPLTFAFYYPVAATESDALTASRFSSLIDAVSRAMYEYQHVLTETQVIQPTGNNETDRVINNEALSHCWYDAIFLGLTSGTHTETEWKPSPEALLASSSGHTTSLETGNQAETGSEQRRYSDAYLWGKYLAAKSISGYLREKGFAEARVRSNNPEAMNAVLSACRSMTQHPLDLTVSAYPPSKVENVPFFPLVPHEDK